MGSWFDTELSRGAGVCGNEERLPGAGVPVTGSFDDGFWWGCVFILAVFFIAAVIESIP
jgi:hypothetical protein